MLALPALALNWWLVGSAATYSEEPRRTAALLAVLGALVVVLAIRTRRDSTAALGRGFLFFFPVFCIFLSLATATDLLTGRRVLLAGDEQAVPRSFLGLSRLGDWHYRFARPAPPVHDLLVVTLPSSAGEDRAEVRRRFAFLIGRAVEFGAKGVGFDYFLEEKSAFDDQLGKSIAGAEKAGIPVVFGYRHRRTEGGVERRTLVSSLAGVIPAERQGHLSAYRESDGRVRMVPTGLGGEGEQRSLSHRIAEILHGGKLDVPARLLQFTRPRFGVPIHEFSPQMDFALLRDRFVLVGTSSAVDRVDTPYGPMQGVEVHAFAVNSLRSGSRIHRLAEHLAFPILFALCYLLTLFYVRGHPSRFLVLAALALGGGLVAAAALAMYESLLWIDVSYPLAGLAALTALLLAIRALRTAHARASGRPAIIAPDPALVASAEGRPGAALEVGVEKARGEGEDGEFDVFLSHNSRDKPAVRELAMALVARGLSPWLDEWELVPGRSWQDELEQVIRTVASSAVLVGADGIGPWEVPELRASLSESVRRGLPVIPVLLPGAPKQPILPLFLTQFTWVDLRSGLTEEGIDRFEWGITGIRPRPR